MKIDSVSSMACKQSEGYKADQCSPLVPAGPGFASTGTGAQELAGVMEMFSA